MVEIQPPNCKKIDLCSPSNVNQGPASGEVRALAFPNNAQAGLLVSSLVQYAALHRADGGDALFVQAPKADDGQEREVCIIDESVYSRNRSFRLLFQSKFGKKRRLDLDAGSAKLAFGVKPHPCFALLETMASFVPDGTELFEHALIPRGFAHMQAKASRSSVIRHKNGSVQAECDPLLNYLIRAWDDIRRLNDTSPMPFEPTSVQSCVEMDERFLTVTLNNNRYCFCKGDRLLQCQGHAKLQMSIARPDCLVQLFAYSRIDLFELSEPVANIKNAINFPAKTGMNVLQSAISVLLDCLQRG